MLTRFLSFLIPRLVSLRILITVILINFLIRIKQFYVSDNIALYVDTFRLKQNFSFDTEGIELSLRISVVQVNGFIDRQFRVVSLSLLSSPILLFIRVRVIALVFDVTLGKFAHVIRQLLLIADVNQQRYNYSCYQVATRQMNNFQRVNLPSAAAIRICAGMYVETKWRFVRLRG